VAIAAVSFATAYCSSVTGSSHVVASRGGLGEDRVVAHHRVGGAAVPVLLPWRGPDGLARTQSNDRAITAGDQADAVGADQQLPVGVGVPVGAGAGGEADQADDERGVVVAEDGVEVDVVGVLTVLVMGRSSIVMLLVGWPPSPTTR
jgi:hypothetical protein